MNRLFKLHSIDNKIIDDISLYKSTTPIQSARKAFNKWCKKNNKQECKKNFSIIEVTPENTKNKEYFYIGIRKKLETPKNIIRDGKKININFFINIKKSD